MVKTLTHQKHPSVSLHKTLNAIGRSSKLYPMAFLSFVNRAFIVPYPMQDRVQKILLLSAAAVRSRICTSGKSQEEIAERCLCSDRQVRNWTSRDTDISVSRLYVLADSLGCKPEELLRSQFPQTGNRTG